MAENQFVEKHTQYPEFMKIVDLIGAHNPLQRKRIKAFVMGQDDDYWAFAEGISAIMNRTLINNETTRIEAAKAYNDLCMDMLCEQIKFRKTGVYPTSKAETARKNVYEQPEAMYRYMMGLLMTQMLWPNHYRMFRFFQDALKETRPSHYLEVGAGHGMFTLEALRNFPGINVMICDISKTSIEMSKRIFRTLVPDLSKIQFINTDFLKSSLEGRRFDFITLGEVLEHVEEPSAFMKKARDLLAPKGVVYISTCVNCPAIDHVYHFRSVRQIQDVLLDSGFSIVGEIILPAEDIPQGLWEEQLITINYAAKLVNKES